MKNILLFTYLLFNLVSYSQTYEIEEIKLIATIQEIRGVNESSDDFSPLFMNGHLYFTSSRQYNEHNIGENNWEKNGYLNIFYGKVQNESENISIKDVKLLSNRLNTGTHTGPISFSSTGDTLFFTHVIQVAKGKELIYKPQLFSSIKKKGKWSKIKRMPFSKNENAYGHPSYDPINKRLYFTSDLPEGKGGKDIYYSELTNGKWTKPINVEAINTEYDEEFPFVVEGNIFFSSNRGGGIGQLDIYYSSPEIANYPIKINGLNSASDDFGISLLPDLSAGYFSSNRNGNDDIFYFTLEKKTTIKNQIAGSFTFRHIDGTPSDLSVEIMDENGEFIYEENTDKDGRFMFNNISLDGDINIRIGKAAKDEMKLDFYDANGNIITSYILTEEGAFKYKKLFYENKGILSFIPEDMLDFELNTALLSGKIVLENQPTKVLKNQIVNLTDINNQIIKSVLTDDLGNFEFANLSQDSVYFIQVPDSDEELLFYIYESNDNIYTQLKYSTEDAFFYRKLRPDLNNNLTLMEGEKEEIFLLNSSEIYGEFSPIDGGVTSSTYIVRVYNDAGLFLNEIKTDSLGKFMFNNLSSENSYRFTAENKDDLLLTLYNRYGEEVARIQKEENDYFIFRPLGYSKINSLSLMDDGMKFDLNLSEYYDIVTVYFNSNETKTKDNDYEKLEIIYKLLKKYPQLKLSISAYADAISSNEYNFILSQKRGEWIVNYLMKKGINKNRITVNAYGENKLIDPGNNAANRRAELRIYQ